MTKFNLVVHPKAYGGQLEFRSINKKQKAWIFVGNSNGHYYLQFHEAKGILTSYIHTNENGINTEDGLIMPKYAVKLTKIAIDYINSFYN